MPDVVGQKVLRPRTGLAGARPLQVRFEEALQTAARTIPETDAANRQCLTLMQSEANLDRVLDAIDASRKRHAPPEPDAATREAINEHYDLKNIFNSCALEIKQAQGWLQYAYTDWRHQLLKDITADLFVSVASVSESPRFANSTEAREAVRGMHARLQWVRAIASKISSARAFEKWPPAEQSIALVQALAAKRIEDEQRIEALEAALMAVQAKLGRLEQQKLKSPKRSTQHTKRKS